MTQEGSKKTTLFSLFFFVIKRTCCTLKALKRILNFIQFDLPSDRFTFPLLLREVYLVTLIGGQGKEAHRLLFKKEKKTYYKIYPKKRLML